jgi:hypothetical protein
MTRGTHEFDDSRLAKPWQIHERKLTDLKKIHEFMLADPPDSRVCQLTAESWHDSDSGSRTFKGVAHDSELGVVSRLTLLESHPVLSVQQIPSRPSSPVHARLVRLATLLPRYVFTRLSSRCVACWIRDGM